ncbi:response regulator transcription factor [Diplocloster agilis]|uniref:Stage 0 sporulation protein A homolog n=1 Tax=Diplocloster agilis TaxID=2850323 RepID=A0A949K4E1_9FIRM|nr:MULTISPECIES: response regulator transcription factor [Lachnospiraceae]MBU9739272.1 response regulator transcription factor [Diplocloster agilis]MCU6733243.1 response regulator transcription factor [Suonthocola fibrivorans]SCI82456.1 Glycopeptide resistance-associated protein R [uncultured Clostridium sp.]
MYRILIVEDDKTIADTLTEHLCKWGYDAKAVDDFDQVMEIFTAFDPQLVLMDIVLPFYNGYHWCSQIRSISKVPVIFLSSASDNMNIIMAVNMGGDDFIAKPFDLDVVVAKIQAMLRRTYSFQGQVSILEHRGAVLNLGDASLTFEGQKTELTKNDFRILEVLMSQKGKVVSREDLMKKLWNDDCFIDDNTLTVNVNRLRRKLDEIGLNDFIATKKGIGYMVGEEQ